MATINLLPWREELRAERKKEFIASLALMALVAIFILFVTDLMFDGRISFQEKRNAYVRQSIAELDEQVAEIRDLRGRRTELLERMRIIQDLQGNRPIIVRIMDQLALSESLLRLPISRRINAKCWKWKKALER